MNRHDPERAYMEFERFPFFVGARAPEDGRDLPETLPFALRIDRRTGVPGLALDARTEQALEAAYGGGSMLSTPLGHSGLSQARLEEMQERVMDLFGGRVAGCRVLEIGCGTGRLLKALQARGAVVAGCEIGPQADEAERTLAAPIAREILRPGLFAQPFDAIISYGCLEHIADLPGFLSTLRACLAPGGLTLHSVPNSTLGFATGSAGHLAHQHVHYFTAENGTRLLRAQGFPGAGAAPTKAGNELHLWGRFEEKAPLSWPGEAAGVREAEAAQLAGAEERLRAALSRQIGGVRALLDGGRSVGFYAAGHVLASLGGFARAIRFFDGDPYNLGRRWLAGFPPIEGPEDLAARPVDELVVCAPHHLASIRERLARAGLPPATRVRPVTEIAA